MSDPIEQAEAAAEKAREDIKPWRKRLDAGEWMSDIGNGMNVERLIRAVDALLAEHKRVVAERDAALAVIERATDEMASAAIDRFMDQRDETWLEAMRAALEAALNGEDTK